MFSLRAVSGGYTDRDISLKVDEGELLGIIGPNGSGKTTLLRMMSGVLKPRCGALTYREQDIYRMPVRELSRSFAFVPQDTQVNFAFTVWEIVLLGRIPHLGRIAFEGRRDYAVAENALELTETGGLKEKFIDALSGGERQRVIIAKALAQEPRLLFLDEPTAHLDIAHKIRILDLLRRLNRENKVTIVIVLHDLNLAAEYCSRIVLLDQGSVYARGRAEDVLTYQNVEAVYKTVVVSATNPITKKPYIMLVPGKS